MYFKKCLRNLILSFIFPLLIFLVDIISGKGCTFKTFIQFSKFVGFMLILFLSYDLFFVLIKKVLKKEMISSIITLIIYILFWGLLFRFYDLSKIIL